MAEPYDPVVQIEFTYARGPAYFDDPRTARTGRPSTAYTVAGVVMAAGIVIAAGWSDVQPALFAGLCLVVGGMFLVVLVRRDVGTVNAPEGALKPRRWLLTDDGLESETELTSARYPWSAFRDVLVWPQAYLLRTDAGEMIDIPREPLTPGDEAVLRELLTQRGLLPAPRRGER
jgi:hypothetical protein